VNEGFVPPAPGPAELRLYTVPRSALRPPVAATDEQGTVWLPALRARDDRYVAPLTLTRYQGIAEVEDQVVERGDALVACERERRHAPRPDPRLRRLERLGERRCPTVSQRVDLPDGREHQPGPRPARGGGRDL